MVQMSCRNFSPMWTSPLFRETFAKLVLMVGYTGRRLTCQIRPSNDAVYRLTSKQDVRQKVRHKSDFWISLNLINLAQTDASTVDDNQERSFCQEMSRR